MVSPEREKKTVHRERYRQTKIVDGEVVDQRTVAAKDGTAGEYPPNYLGHQINTVQKLIYLCRPQSNRLSENLEVSSRCIHIKPLL